MGTDRKLDNVRTNSTTPTIRATTNETATCAILEHGFNLNYTDAVAYSSVAACETTGGINHICTLDSINITNRTGVHGFSIGCKDATTNSNENRTSTSGLFQINITDPIPPQIILDKPDAAAFFVNGTNNTNIKFNWTGSDNADKNIYNCSVNIDNISQYINTSYINGTQGILRYTENTIGSHTWNVTCTDNYNNVNSSQRSFDVLLQQPIQQDTVILSLDLLNNTRKYEYGSLVNISANCTSSSSSFCQVEIDIPFIGRNLSFGSNKTDYIFNLSVLRRTNFSNGSSSITFQSSDLLNLTSDNRTKMIRIALNVSNSGTSTNLNITYFDITQRFKGDIVLNRLIDTEFIYLNIYKTAVNLTYTQGGSNSIFINLTGLDNNINLSFDLTGFELDLHNLLSYTEHFNGTTGSRTFNDTLSYRTDAPLGIFDDFTANNSIWSVTDVDCSSADPTLSYITESGATLLKSTIISAGCTIKTDYSSTAADFRNSSRIMIIYNNFLSCDGTGSTTPQARLMVRDGTNEIQLYQDEVNCISFGSSDSANFWRNATLLKKSSDYKTWELFINGTSQGNKDLSSLDFTKQIKLGFNSFLAGGGSENQEITYKFDTLYWSGAWLNRSVNNGTYKNNGNVTQCIQKTTDPISRALLSAFAYIPTNTTIDGYYLSNNNGTTFESVTNNLIHTFSSLGGSNSYPCWRAELNSSSNISSPVIRKISIDIVPSTIENVTVALNNVVVFTNNNKLNSTTSPWRVNLTSSAGFKTIKISSAKAGTIQVNNFIMNYTLEKI